MSLRIAAAVAWAFMASPVIAQNTNAASPPASGPPVVVVPPAGPPPVTVVPATPEAPDPEPAAPANVVVVQPAPEPVPEPMTISPDAAYPNGFADPDDPFGNDMSLAQRDDRPFPWGLLGLLGLLGLIPLFRRGGATVRTVYVDRDDPDRVIREERTER